MERVTLTTTKSSPYSSHTIYPKKSLVTSVVAVHPPLTQPPRLSRSFARTGVTSLYKYHVEAIEEKLPMTSELYYRSASRVCVNSVKHDVILPKIMRFFPGDDGNVRALLKRIVE